MGGSGGPGGDSCGSSDIVLGGIFAPSESNQACETYFLRLLWQYLTVNTYGRVDMRKLEHSIKLAKIAYPRKDIFQIRLLVLKRNLFWVLILVFDMVPLPIGFFFIR